jgi:hypothetical protein
VPRLRRSTILAIVSQPFRAGLMFGYRPYGPRTPPHGGQQNVPIGHSLARKASTSAAVGSDGWAPARVTEIAAAADA